MRKEDKIERAIRNMAHPSGFGPREAVINVDVKALTGRLVKLFKTENGGGPGMRLNKKDKK